MSYYPDEIRNPFIEECVKNGGFTEQQARWLYENVINLISLVTLTR